MLRQLKEKIKECMYNGDKVKLSIYRVVLGDCERIVANNGTVSDEEVLRVIKKAVQSNLETIKLSKNEADIAIMREENAALAVFIPKEATEKEMTQFLTDNAAEILAAKTDGEAIKIAMKIVPGDFNKKFVSTKIKSMRSQEA